MNSDRQTAETSEGNVQIAAGFGLAIVEILSFANIADGLSITAVPVEETVDGETLAKHVAFTIHSTNETDVDVRADASATQSEIGVGVAVYLYCELYQYRISR